MSLALAPIASAAEIIEKDPQTGKMLGTISVFFRQWLLSLIDRLQKAVYLPTAAIQKTNQHAAIGTAIAYTVAVGGIYRISYAIRKVVADGVSSSLTVTLGWVHRGASLSLSGAALTADSTTAFQSGTTLAHVDASSNITYAVAYASNTPDQMQYDVDVTVEAIS